MKKKSLVTMLGLLALVGAVGVGSTLAYLSDETAALTNTFTFTDAGIRIALDEAKVDENNRALADGTRVQEGETQEYKNIVPGMTMDKDPTVTVKANSLNCNVFVSVTNANAEAVLKIDEIGDWTELDPAAYGLEAMDATKYYVYAGANATGTVEEQDTFKVVAASAEDTVLDDVFETVTVGIDVNQDTVFKNIVIKASAVQADNCSDEEAAKAALEMLGAE